MAKTVDQWQADMIAAKSADPTIGTGGVKDLSSSSVTAVWRIFVRLVADAMATLEEQFGFHKAEVETIINAQKAHKLNWYVGKAEAYQHGDSLPADADVYNPVRDAGDAAFVVSFAAGVEADSQIQIKAAKGTPGALSALSGAELTGLQAYMKRIKDAGVRVVCTSSAADTLQPTMVIHYDPLILDNTGARLDGSATNPVKDAVNAFLAAIPFDGRFILDNFIAALMAVEGVKVAEITTVQAYYGVVAPATITNWYNPDAGYLALDEAFFDANVTFTAYTL